MSIANKFKNLEDNKSAFYTFSEYTNDLVNNINGGSTENYASPYKFICCNIDRDSIVDDIQEYENEAAALRGQYIGGNSVEYKDTLYDKLVGKTGITSLATGDIDVFCDDVIDGERYDEFVCYLGPDSTEEAITFNSIVVLYQIGDGNKYHDIPLGIYIASAPITKQANDEDVYNQGTSYALRVCMRFASTNALDGVRVTTSNVSTDYQGLTSVIARLNDTMDKYDAMAAAFNNYANIVRENQTAAIMTGYSMKWLGFNDGTTKFVDTKNTVSDITDASGTIDD